MLQILREKCYALENIENSRTEAEKSLERLNKDILEKKTGAETVQHQIKDLEHKLGFALR